MTLTLNTPLAEALSNQIQPKLVEIGWSVGGEDSSPLSEYICLMLVNGKSQEQIAQELSGDLLGLPPGDSSASDFAKWLFEKVDELNRALGNGQPTQPDDAAAAAAQSGDDEMMQDGEPEAVPNAPKAMRQPNPHRLMNQLSKAMERQPSDVPLHRVRQQPSERVDKFKREPPRGPSSNRPNHRPGHMGNNSNQRHPYNRMNGGGRLGFQNPIPPSAFANMNPQQQMAFFQMYQQQSQMMAPFMNPAGGPHTRGFPPAMGLNGQVAAMGMMADEAYSNNFAVPQRVPPGPSLFERIEAPPPDVRSNRYNHNNNHSSGRFGGSSHEKADGSAMDTSESGRDETMEDTESATENNKPEETPCKFGTHCTNKDCIFGHPPPAAAAFGGPRKTYISGEKCPFGAGCKNRKCTGSHPSPASAKGAALKPGKIDQDCKFFPNCTNPSCPYKHPAMPPCRFGANCTRPDCHFTHNTKTLEIACKFHPCLNPNCGFKHEEGQQQEPPTSTSTSSIITSSTSTAAASSSFPPSSAAAGQGFENKVWVNKGKHHVSDRRFVAAAAGEEELIIPGQGVGANSAGGGGGDGEANGAVIAKGVNEGEGDMDTAPVEDGLDGI